MVGIHGMGGIGKSTLARAVYNELIIAEKFDGLCFLANVRENSNKHGLEHLQRILLSEIIREKNINLTSKQQGISIIQSRLTGKKVLLILDDVDTHEQLQAIAGRPDWFGPGSKIIITTLDKQLLASHEVNKTYEVKELNANDALQLLTWNAFKKDKADPTYVKVLRRAVTYASGLPLALEVIGSHLFGKSIEEWEFGIKHFKRIPKKEILEILKVSFDALEEEERSVFLDIACCFKGCNLQEVEHILRSLYDDCMKHHTGVLVEKSLINVSRSGVVNMHDLIQDMGRRIDQQESSKEPGKRRRLWLTKDIIQVLKDNSGQSEIEIICLDFSLSEKEATIEWNGNAFKKMKNLKILIIRNGFMQLDHMKTLCLMNNNFTFLPECIKELQFLRRLDVSGCLHLQEIRGVPPNLKNFKALECILLSSSSSSMLSSQELHEAGQTMFRFPGATIPEWFNHQSRGPSCSFWFRNEFPDNVLCLLLARVQWRNQIDYPMPTVFINGKLAISSRGIRVKKVKLSYSYLFDLKSACMLDDDLFEVNLEKEWNHVEITYAGLIEASLVKATGIHVFRQDDIRYDDPYGKGKIDHDLNSSESQPLIKKHRLFCRLSRWVGPERITNLLGNAADGALITRYRHISMDSSCRRCGVLEETCMHGLRDCPDVAAFWSSVLPKQLAPKFFNGDVTVWLETNLSFSVAAFSWPTFFGIAVELLWEFRNELVFCQDDLNELVSKRYKDFIRAHASPNLMTRNLLKWRRPKIDQDWLLRLNVSGAFDPSSGTAACGGIFRDYNSTFVLGYSVKVGECSSNDMAEIWGIYHGMKIARQYDIWAVYRHILRQHSIPMSLKISRQHDFGRIRVLSGSQKAIGFVLDGCPTYTSTSTSTSLQHCFPFCAELQALTSGTNHLYCICRANKAAKSFAKFGLSMKQQAASIFSACPSFCKPFVLDEW